MPSRPPPQGLTTVQATILAAAVQLHMVGRFITDASVKNRTKMGHEQISAALKALVHAGHLSRRPGSGKPVYRLERRADGSAVSHGGNVEVRDGVKVRVCDPGFAIGYGWGPSIEE